MPKKTSRKPGWVFVSYAREDLDRVRNLLEYLDGKKFDVWWDDKIGIGDRFRDSIQSALNEAACVVVIWTKASVDSVFVRSEAQKGLDKGMLLPVTLDTNLQIPLPFEEVQQSKLESWSGGDHPELAKLAEKICKLIKAGPTKEVMPTLARDNNQIDDSHRIISEMQHAVSEIRNLSGVLDPNSPSAADLRTALAEVDKTYRAVSSAVLAFKMQATQPSISAAPFLKLESSDLRSRIENGRGHCTLIQQLYYKTGGLAQYLDTLANDNKVKVDVAQIDAAISALAQGDDDFFRPLEKIGELLSNESRVVANLLLAGQEAAARQRIVDGRLKLQPIEDELTSAGLDLQRVESSLGYVGKSGHGSAVSRRHG